MFEGNLFSELGFSLSKRVEQQKWCGTHHSVFGDHRRPPYGLQEKVSVARLLDLSCPPQAGVSQLDNTLKHHVREHLIPMSKKEHGEYQLSTFD